MKSGMKAQNRRSFRTFLLFLLPAVLVYSMIIVYPMLSSFYYSLTEWSGLGKARFIGMNNYVRLFTDPNIYPVFWRALGHNFYIFALTLIIQTPLALYFAYALDRKVRGHAIYRNVIFFPVLISTVTVAFMSLIVFEPNIGLLNNLLDKVGLEDWVQPWLGMENLILLILVLIMIWKSIGVNMMLYLANLQSIPGEVLEAAMMDGATEFQKFRKMIFPLLAPSFTINVVLTFIGSIGTFDIVYAIAGENGQPNFSADVLGTFYYRTAFTQTLGLQSSDMGLATAIALVMFFIILVVSVIQLKLLQKRELEY
ncbi:carbohydrate ABC transporter permease [Cohnella nanjingensis]|uniref:Sugar ABC transporter permease n=1 Tax=Cohnella nanjingensis TaxID=1387779 RepID=A0A7X0RRD5_9BACL|nr:sugar ABC transporter permease [Cohnella nanjingensis]MBB6672258.1 sugar ABC transporter permease [Cohnella nanjingensis]